MDDEENISNVREGTLIHNYQNFEFVQKDGLYAYNEFFVEGKWPDNLSASAMYRRSIKLKMVKGEWCESLSDLIRTLPWHPFYAMLDLIGEQESIGMDKVVREWR